MEILKQGNKQKAKTHFKCKRCGCEFLAEEGEFQYPSQLELQKEGIKAKCICPTCGSMIYKQ